ncbi:MAG TPA: hypothetical protein VF268_14095 [Gammaproteobacteria bacterium]
MIDESEREDFKQAIRDEGLEVEDFELIEKRSPPPVGEKIYAITGTVIIKRKSNSVEKEYQAGHGSIWPTEFSDDLNAGVFG